MTDDTFAAVAKQLTAAVPAMGLIPARNIYLNSLQIVVAGLGDSACGMFKITMHKPSISV